MRRENAAIRNPPARSPRPNDRLRRAKKMAQNRPVIANSTVNAVRAMSVALRGSSAPVTVLVQGQRIWKLVTFPFQVAISMVTGTSSRDGCFPDQA